MKNNHVEVLENKFYHVEFLVFFLAPAMLNGTQVTKSQYEALNEAMLLLEVRSFPANYLGVLKHN